MFLLLAAGHGKLKIVAAMSVWIYCLTGTALAFSDCEGMTSRVAGATYYRDAVGNQWILLSARLRNGDWRVRVLDVVPQATIQRVTLSTTATAIRVVTESGTDTYDLIAAPGYLGPDHHPGGHNRAVEVFGEPLVTEPAAALDLPRLRTAAAQALGAELARRGGLEKAPEIARGIEKAPEIAAAPAWSLYCVTAPSPALYSPILELHPDETKPTAVGIWDKLAGQTIHPAWPKGVQISEVVSRTKRIGDEIGCSVYARVDPQFADVLLYQYWYYYPFDAGGFEDHLHDSEQFFVEVDPLGGVILRVIGAAHGPWATNNVFKRDMLRDAPLQLPLHAFVEFRKHAMAPDINGDGIFTPGIDT